MEKISDEDFIEVFEGTFASSQEDRAGDTIPPEELDRMRNQIKSQPEKRKFLDGHNPEKVVGKVVDIWTEWGEEEDIYYLRGKIGVFEGNEGVAEEIRSGEKSGLSIGGYSYPDISKDEWGKKEPDAAVAIPVDEKDTFYKTITSRELDFRFQIEKALAETDVVEFLIQNHEQTIELAKAISIWYLGRKSSDVNITVPEVTIYKQEIDIEINEILKKSIEVLNEKSTEDDVEKVIKETAEDLKNIEK